MKEDVSEGQLTVTCFGNEKKEWSTNPDSVGDWGSHVDLQGNLTWTWIISDTYYGLMFMAIYGIYPDHIAR